MKAVRKVFFFLGGLKKKWRQTSKMSYWQKNLSSFDLISSFYLIYRALILSPLPRSSFLHCSKKRFQNRKKFFLEMCDCISVRASSRKLLGSFNYHKLGVSGSGLGRESPCIFLTHKQGICYLQDPVVGCPRMNSYKSKQ